MPKHPSIWFERVLPALFVMFGMIVLLSPLPSRAEQSRKAAPDWQLSDVNGKPLKLSDFRGKVVVLDFWATWCPPCRDEEPSLRKLARAMDPGTFQLVAVSVDEGGWPAIDKFFAGNSPPYAVALDREARISQTYGTTRFPESYLVDSSGTLRLKFIGPRNWSDPAVFTLLDSYGARKRKD